MSRIGRLPVNVPENVEMNLCKNLIMFKGPLGESNLNIPEGLLITHKENKIYIQSNDKKIWGTFRTLIEQHIIGVTEGYVYNLELVGVGYKGSVEGDSLVLKLGYSHDIVHKIKKNLNITCRKPTFISIFGIDKQYVSQEASRIRDYRKPEPYKGKGIIYENEIVIRKEGKKK